MTTIRWSDWSDAAFARAREERRPVLLALTASWCHACHRMDEETWGDPGVAAAVERATVPVRVDADARPDVYDRYHAGGLPSTMLLTPEAGFIRGGTFLSRPQLFAFLEAGLRDFAGDRRPAGRGGRAPSAPANLVDEVVARLRRRADLEHGGFGVAPKVPDVHALVLLLRRWRVSADADLRRIVRTSLDAISTHLRDPRDGGFFRYAAGRDWSGPHTEKLALDQAQLVRLLLEAGVSLGEPAYVDAARGALAQIRGRLADSGGRIFSSIAADPQYRADRAPDAEDAPEVDQRRFAAASAAVVSAGVLCRAVTGEDFGFEPEYRRRAPMGAIPHRLDAPDELHGLLRDQTLGLRAAIDEYRLEGDPALLGWARQVAEWSIAHLWDERASAFRSEPAVPGGLLDLPPMFPLVPNAEMALGLVELADHGGETAYRTYAQRLLDALSAEASVSPVGTALALVSQRLAEAPAEADVLGSPGDAAARDLSRAVLTALGPTSVIRRQPGVPSLTLCVGELCLPSLDSPAELVQTLVDLGLAPRSILTNYSAAAGG